MTLQHLLNRFEAATLLGMRAAQIDRLVRSGEIPHIRLPGLPAGEVRFDQGDVLDWAASFKLPADDPDGRDASRPPVTQFEDFTDVTPNVC